MSIVRLSFEALETGFKAFEDEVVELKARPLMNSKGEVIPVVHKEAFVLRPGTFNGRYKFTPEDLREIAENYDPKDKPPIQIEHSLSANDTNGYVLGLKTIGEGPETRLHALLEFRGSNAVEKVEAELWNKLSGGFMRKPVQKMHECSVTLRPAVGADGGEPARLLTEETEKPKMSFVQKLFARLLAKEAGKETDEEVTPEDLKEVAENLGVDIKEESETIEQLTAEANQAKEEARLAKEEAEAAKLKLEEERAEARRAENLSLVQGLVKEGRILPKDQETAQGFIESLSDEQRETWLKLYSEQEPAIELGRKSLPDTSKPAGMEQDREALLKAGKYQKDADGKWVKLGSRF